MASNWRAGRCGSDRGGDPNGSERGATTAEALVAGLVLSIGLLAVTQVMIGASRASAAADHRTVAARIATSQLGLVRSLADDRVGIDITDADAVTSFEGLPTVAGSVAPLDPVIVVTNDGVDYEVRRHVLWATVDADPQAYKRVVVTVSWTDGGTRFDHRADTGIAPTSQP